MLAILQQHLDACTTQPLPVGCTPSRLMSAPSLKERFDFIIMEDDSFVYLHTGADQLACLRRVREHLGADGHLPPAFFHAST